MLRVLSLKGLETPSFCDLLRAASREFVFLAINSCALPQEERSVLRKNYASAHSSAHSHSRFDPFLALGGENIGFA